LRKERIKISELDRQQYDFQEVKELIILQITWVRENIYERTMVAIAALVIIEKLKTIITAARFRGSTLIRDP